MSDIAVIAGILTFPIPMMLAYTALFAIGSSLAYKGRRGLLNFLTKQNNWVYLVLVALLLLFIVPFSSSSNLIDAFGPTSIWLFLGVPIAVAVGLVWAMAEWNVANLLSRVIQGERLRFFIFGSLSSSGFSSGGVLRGGKLMGIGFYVCWLIAVSLLEEYLWRGILWYTLSEQYGLSLIFVLFITAASYGSIHIAFGAYGVLGKFLAGLLFGALLIIFGNIAVTMVAHVMFNLSVTLIGYVRIRKTHTGSEV